MKKLHLLKTMLLLCALIVGSSSVWADTSTLTPTESKIAPSDDHFTVTYGGSGSATKWNSTCVRLYAKNAITFASKNGETITQITFTGTVNANNKRKYPNSMSASIGTITPSTISSTGEKDFEWTYATGSTEVTITLGGTAGNIDLTGGSYVVTYTASSKTATTTTIDDSDISNTDLKNGTTAGSLSYSVTVTSGGADVDGATVTWSSDDESVATIDEDGVVTLVGVGTATITASYAGDETYNSSSDTYVLTVTDTREDAGLAFDDDSQTVGMGSILTAPTLTNPHNLAVTYSSDDTSIATVDEDGNVTGVAMGFTTITASFAGNSTYKAGSASYTITVTRVAAANSIWYESFDDNDKTGGNDGTWSGISTTPDPVFDLTGWTYNKAYGASKCVRTGKGGYLTSPAIGVAGNVTLTFKMESWGNDTGYGYVDIVGDGTFEDEKTRAELSLNKSGKWKNFTLKLIGVTEETKVKFFHTNSDKRLFIDEVEVFLDKQAVTVTKAGYATFVSDYDLDYSETGITVYTATDNTTYVKLNEVAGGQVPANTPVVLYKAGADGSAIDVPVIAEADPVGSNDLSVVGAGGLSGEDGVYVLAKKANGVGFYLWDKSVTLNEGKVCLRTGGSSAREFLSFDEGETTSLSEVKGLKSEVRGEYFNLNGQRVSQPTKGLYIVNGRKVVIK